MYYVYKYIDKENNLLYVGQTIDLDRRFNEHKGKTWDVEKQKILFAKCNSLADMNLYEMYYINKLKPKYNTALVFGDSPSFEIPELYWEEYNKNHFELKQKEVSDNFRKNFNDKFSPENYWKNKIEGLNEEFNQTEDFLRKKEILIEIRTCTAKLNKNGSCN